MLALMESNTQLICGWRYFTFHFMLLILKTVISGPRQTLVTTISSHCISLMWQFGAIPQRLFFWALYYFKSLVLHSDRNSVQSLQNIILCFCLAKVCLHWRRVMCYLSSLSFRMVHSRLHCTEIKTFLLENFSEDSVLFQLTIFLSPSKSCTYW